MKHSHFIPVIRYLLFLGALCFLCAASLIAQPENYISKPYKPVEFTNAELAWLKAHPLIRIHAPDEFLPDAFWKDYIFQGTLRDYTDIISQRTGVRFEFVNIPNAEVDEKITAHELDVRFTYGIPERRHEMLFTDPLATVGWVIVTRSDNPFIGYLSRLKGCTVAVIKGMKIYNRMLKDYPDIRLYPVSDPIEGLKAVDLGEADAFINTPASIAYAMRQEKLQYLRIDLLTEYPAEPLMYGVRNDWPELVSILNKGIGTITQDDRNQIFDRWIPLQIRKEVDWLVIWKWTGVIGSLLSLIFGLTLFWNRRLAQEIQHRKKAEISLRESEEQFRHAYRRLDQIIEFLPDATFVIDLKGNVIAWNKAIEAITGVPKSEMIGKGNMEYALPFYGERRQILIDLALLPDEEFGNRHYRYISRMGHTLFAETYVKGAYQGKGAYMWGVATPLWDDSGNVVGAIESIRDISEHKQIEEELLKAKEAAEAASRAKSEFLANMSHEIRTPMNAILGFSEILESKIEAPENRHYLSLLRNAGKNLLNLINDILDLSKIEAGKMELDYKPMNIREVLNEIVRIFSHTLEEKRIEFILDIDSNLPKFLILDEIRFRQIMFNLVGNAVKFTESGYIKLTARSYFHNDTPDTGDLVVSVEDTGIGIPEDQRERIFGMFEQQKGQAGQRGGTGLGLAITKRLTEMMGGTIEVSGTEGKGSVFTVRFKNIRVDGIHPLLSSFPSSCSQSSLGKSETIKKEHGRIQPLPFTLYPSPLGTLLETSFIPRWQELQKMMVMDDIERFAEELLHAVQEYNLPHLTDYAQRLLNHVQGYDIVETKKAMAEFSSFFV